MSGAREAVTVVLLWIALACVIVGVVSSVAFWRRLGYASGYADGVRDCDAAHRDSVSMLERGGAR